MKKTFTIDETGEVITANIDGVNEMTAEQLKEVRRKYLRNQLKTFSNSEKKRYLIRRLKKW